MSDAINNANTTPIVDHAHPAPPTWVAFNWQNQRYGLMAEFEFHSRPRAGFLFVIPQGTWQGDWCVRAHDGASSTIFFAERTDGTAP